MSEFVTDDVWLRALSVAEIPIDPISNLSLSNRKRVEAACSFLRANTHTPGKGITFADAAEAGRVFLSGLVMAENTVAWMQMMEPADSPLQKLDFKFDDTLFARSIKAIKILKVFNP